MDAYEKISRVIMRRKYTRIEGSEFVVKRRRVKVAQLHDVAPKRSGYRLKLRRYRLQSLAPRRLLASMKDTYTNLMTVLAPKAGKKEVEKINHTAPLLMTYPRRRPVASSKEVVDEAWFNRALARSIAEGRITNVNL